MENKDCQRCRRDPKDEATNPSKDTVVLGGATLLSSLMNLDLIDELRLMVNPLVLGGGNALFKDVKDSAFFEAQTS